MTRARTHKPLNVVLRRLGPAFVLVGACNGSAVPSGSGDAGSTGGTGSTEATSLTSDGTTTSSSDDADTTAAGSGTSGSDSSTTGPSCGDEAIEGDEQCDTGELAGQDCVTQGFDGGRLACAGDCTFDTAGCFDQVCGSGVIEGTEICDGADLGRNTCESEGFDAGTLACTDACMLDTAACTTVSTFCAMPGFFLEVGVLTFTQILPPIDGTVVDVDVSIGITDSTVGDLELTIEHVPSALPVMLIDNLCASANDIDAVFDQDAPAAPDCVEPIAVEGNVLPLEDLDVYDGMLDASGAWDLTINDNGPGDADPGTIDEWCVILETQAEPR